MPSHNVKAGMRPLAALFAFGLVVSACGLPEEAATTTTEVETTTTSPTVDTTREPEPGNGNDDRGADVTPQGVEQRAVADLAVRLRVDDSEIVVIRAEATTWPDGSLGCPEPGMFYTQALVEGYQVVLEHDSRVYLYHAGGDGEPFLCPSDEEDGGHEFVPPPGFDE